MIPQKRLGRVVDPSLLSFGEEWLSAGNMEVVPFLSLSGMDKPLAGRISAAARSAGYASVIAWFPGPPRVGGQAISVAASTEAILAEFGQQEGLAIALPDLAAALLVTRHGFALFAGSGKVFHAGVPEGRDRAVIDFERFAKRVKKKNPNLCAATAGFAPTQTAWAKPANATEDSATATQLALMESFSAGGIDAACFARSWLAARRDSLERSERLRDQFSRILDRVFYALDDYAIDPAFQEEGDMTDEQLKAVVREALTELQSL
ncbi:colicin immunity domain-containing protein [Streptomyces sp. CA-181903]|uniref:colicin immunity domain-containing protein n=1 Tax=Streptomyces sp. CA-181903 TaxID=3240055 RepID=UPI003D8E2C7B